MSTQANNGNSFILKVSSDGGTTWQTVAAATDAQLKRKGNAIDITNKDSNGDQENMQGVRSWSLQSSHLLVLNDSGQKAFETAYSTGADVMVQVAENGSGNLMEGTGLITELDWDAKNDAAVTYDVTITGTGPLSYTGEAI